MGTEYSTFIIGQLIISARSQNYDNRRAEPFASVTYGRRIGSLVILCDLRDHKRIKHRQRSREIWVERDKES